MPPSDPPLYDPDDVILDLSSAAPAPKDPPTAPTDTPAAANTPPSPPLTPARPFLSIYFKCCNAYARIYRNREGTAYAGNCPKCARPARVPIGPGGSSSRFFTAE